MTDETLKKEWQQAQKIKKALYKEALNDPALFASLVLKNEETGNPITLAPMHIAWHDMIDKHDRLICWSHFEGGKCFSKETRVLMYDGSIKNVDTVVVGDKLMGPDSTVRNVLSVTSGRGPMYRIIPKKGDPWECNNVHVLTLVHSVTGEVIDIQLNEYLTKSAFWKSNYKLFQPGPIEFPINNQERIVDPYFLGVWLGDGSKDLHSIEITKPDGEIAQLCFDEAKKWGLSVSTDMGKNGCPSHRIVGNRVGPGANPLLKAMKELMSQGIRIPNAYLTGPLAARAALLAGLLDTDGYATKRGCFEIVQARKDLTDDISFLARSLGLRVTYRVKKVNNKDYHRLFISGDMALLPLRIPRKAAFTNRIGGKDSRRTGFKVEFIGEGDYYGFALDGDSRLLLEDFTVTHNSQQLSILRPLYELAKNPRLRIVIVSNTVGQSEKLLRSITRYIEKSDELKEITNLKPGNPWTSTEIYIESGSFIAKDPSVRAIGVHGNIMGARIDLLILDDVLDFENTATKAQRQKVIDWFHSTLVGRLTEKARVIVVGNAYYPDDLLHKLAQTPGYTAVRYPVIDDDPESPTYGQSRWPERWPMERIERAKEEMGPLEFTRKMMCRARDDSESKFKIEWINICLGMGEGKSLCHGIDRVPPGYRIITGVDLAVSKKDSADYTCLFTIAVHPNGAREVIDIQTGRWSGPEIVDRIIDTQRRYHSLIIVESNGAQQFILDFAGQRGSFPIKPYNTNKSKTNPEFGIESIAAEMANGRWIIPNVDGRVHPEIRAWIDEMLYFNPQEHTGDRLMASFFCREGINMLVNKAESGWVNWHRR